MTASTRFPKIHHFPLRELLNNYARFRRAGERNTAPVGAISGVRGDCQRGSGRRNHAYWYFNDC